MYRIIISILKRVVHYLARHMSSKAYQRQEDIAIIAVLTIFLLCVIFL